MQAYKLKVLLEFDTIFIVSSKTVLLLFIFSVVNKKRTVFDFRYCNLFPLISKFKNEH
jgi:hypothetical protein